MGDIFLFVFHQRFGHFLYIHVSNHVTSNFFDILCKMFDTELLMVADFLRGVFVRDFTVSL